MYTNNKKRLKTGFYIMHRLQVYMLKEEHKEVKNVDYPNPYHHALKNIFIFNSHVCNIYSLLINTCFLIYIYYNTLQATCIQIST